ncbi:MAG: HAD-IC family P-type ATPase [Chloroflexi bacterium]|nr:HAD-IC family P-type ATPase [Chloroflexota bacterium]
MSAQTTQQFTGLSAAEVAERVARGEANDYQARVGRTYWQIFRDNILNLFNIVLGTLLIIVLLFQDYATVFFAGFSVVTNSFLGMIQEMNAKRRLDRLAALAASLVCVYRDGDVVALPKFEIVKDDILPIEPGDRLVVDGTVLHSDGLEMDESQLTGESDAILKEAGDQVQSGTYCVGGSGVMIATRVGAESTVNQISTIAKTYKRVLTPTQRKIVLIVQLSVIIMAVCTPMIFAAGYITDGEIFNLEIFRNAVVFVSSLVPQGLVLTATLALTLGALSISRFRTLVQRVNAVESMANVTTLCFDKTGTLTKNQLSVVEIRPLNGHTVAEVTAKLAHYTQNLAHQNRTAGAVADYIAAEAINGSGGQALLTKQREVPFTSTRQWGAVVFADETLILGAPERVLTDAEGAPAQEASAIAANGLRVLALARSTAPMPDGVLVAERDPVALIILSDQIREDSEAMLAEFREQSIALKVISGDNLETVREIAIKAGMTIRRAYTGDEIEAMTPLERVDAVKKGDLFARVEPDTKRKIVNTLTDEGEYVAMVGDGVNDVPALKAANLAIVMNDGAQISKDIADIVLLNNAMSTLPRALKDGRIITQSIYGTSKIFLVKNIYSTLLFLFAGFMAMPFPISPIQISWLTFGVINVPAGLMALRVLRPRHMRAFRRDVLDYVVTAGFIGAAAMAFVFGATYLASGQDLDQARSTVTIFMTLFSLIVLWNVLGIELLHPRTILAHLWVFVLGIVAAAGTIAVMYLAPLVLEDDVFEFVPPTPQAWGMIAIVFGISAVLLHFTMRKRELTERLWELLSPP